MHNIADMGGRNDPCPLMSVAAEAGRPYGGGRRNIAV